MNEDDAGSIAMEDALRRLGVTLGTALDWTTLEAFLPEDWREPRLVRSAMASTFAATLELARDGVVALRQNEPFGTIELRKAAP
jgi:segregation and condensation protein A